MTIINLLTLIIAAPLVGVFEDRAASLGVDFEHRTGATGEYFFPEINGSGVALFDADNDGDLDLWLVQSGTISEGGDDAYFENVAGSFHRRSAAIRSDEAGYGMGIATGDVDGDGLIDVFVSQLGPSQLYRNLGGSFETMARPGENGDWSTSAAFLDFDRDGDLDLYVANYVDFDLDLNPRCVSATGRRDYCGPSGFVGQRDRFFRNDDGKLVDATSQVFPDMSGAPGLGVVTGDFNDDGFIDIYVANDGAANFLWLNQAGKRFVDDALFAGVALNGSGRPEASMGIAAHDFDGDGDIDIFLSHLMEETNTLYANAGKRGFQDVTARAGLAAPSMGYTGWGTAFTDIDLDGALDLIVFNGAVRTIESQLVAGAPYPFVESNQAFRNSGHGTFTEVSDRMGKDFLVPYSSRGAAFGDIDNDGDADIIVNNGNGPAQVFVHQGPREGRSWIGVALETSARAEGARVQLVRGEEVTTHWSRTSGSYASASDPRLRFWFADGDEETAIIRVTWTDGSSSEHPISGYNRYHAIPAKED